TRNRTIPSTVEQKPKASDISPFRASSRNQNGLQPEPGQLPRRRDQGPYRGEDR
uniref:Uncharacterized protein n=1 Tax=Aegilops tauschii subsp. strangulata TaxID=200361 RepID=A0A452ZQ73_AEGTS